MAVPASELRAQIAMTAAFVNTRPVDVVMTPYEWTSDGSGGRKKTAAAPRTPQRVRFVEGDIGRRLSDIGEQYVQAATILAVPDAVIAVDDEFDWDGGRWRVEEVLFPNEYEIRATVLRYGR